MSEDKAYVWRGGWKRGVGKEDMARFQVTWNAKGGPVLCFAGNGVPLKVRWAGQKPYRARKLGGRMRPGWSINLVLISRFL